MMSTAMTPDTELTLELIERVMKLSRENLGRLVGLALERLDEPPDDPEEVKEASRVELQRRWDAIQNGEATYTAAEAIAYAREQLRLRRAQ